MDHLLVINANAKFIATYLENPITTNVNLTLEHSRKD